MADVSWEEIEEDLEERVQNETGLDAVVIGRGDDYEAAWENARGQLPEPDLNNPRYDATTVVDIEMPEEFPGTVLGLAYNDRGEDPDATGKGYDGTGLGRDDTTVVDPDAV